MWGRVLRDRRGVHCRGWSHTLRSILHCSNDCTVAMPCCSLLAPTNGGSPPAKGACTSGHGSVSVHDGEPVSERFLFASSRCGRDDTARSEHVLGERRHALRWLQRIAILCWQHVLRPRREREQLLRRDLWKRNHVHGRAQCSNSYLVDFLSSCSDDAEDVQPVRKRSVSATPHQGCVGVGTFHGDSAAGYSATSNLQAKVGTVGFLSSQMRFSTSRPLIPLEFCSADVT